MNIYGYLDAILRFPSVPQLESYFCLKLLVAVIAKTVAYSLGFIEIHRWALLFLSALFLNVWLLPVLYVLAVPYGDSSPFRKDRDMLVQLVLFLVDPRERSDMLHLGAVSLRSLRRSLSSSSRTGAVTVPLGPARTELVVNEKTYL